MRTPAQHIDNRVAALCCCAVSSNVHWNIALKTSTFYLIFSFSTFSVWLCSTSFSLCCDYRLRLRLGNHPIRMGMCVPCYLFSWIAFASFQMLECDMLIGCAHSIGGYSHTCGCSDAHLRQLADKNPESNLSRTVELALRLSNYRFII